MKALKPILFVLLIVAISGAIASVAILRNRQAALTAARQKAARAAELDRLARQSSPAPQPLELVRSETPPKITPESAPEPPKTNLPARTPPAPTPTPMQVAPAPSPREQRQDPMARVALSFVGVDPLAEEYWLEAIHDPNLSDGEREDLMEDLNEEGLIDPRHPAPEDFPLIANRLRIIEEVAPYADQFMLTHLAEAYKDLLQLYGQR